MPLKLKVGKRKGCYELSKDLYVVSIQLMDDGHPPLQCTLSTESSGKDCLDYVCQRLEIKQKFYFGLRYKTKGMFYRWVEVDKPLRKQLDKYGAKPQDQRLQFAVMFHTPDASLLTDESSRYYYFLQMKNDIIEGRLLVTPEKAILLASYSLQVELGDHDEKTHTVESLQQFTLLPKHMTSSAQILGDLIRQVVLGHKSLRGLPSPQAELLYITETQHCEGYGEDYFQGRDEDGKEAFVGYCLEGIIVKRLQGVPIKYRWEEMSRITSHKRTFLINFAEVSAIPFAMEDCETCKYAAYICNLQLAFFRDYLWSLRSKKKMDYANGNGVKGIATNLPTSYQNGKVLNSMSQNNGAAHEFVQESFCSNGNMPDLLPYKNGQALVGNGAMNNELPLPPERQFSTLQNLRPLSYSTPHIFTTQAFDISQLSLNTSQSSANEQFQSNSGVAVTGDSLGADASMLVLPATPPPYRPAPDYETALKQPSLEEYKQAIWERRREIDAGKLTENDVYFPAQNGSYVVMGPDGPVCWPAASSNPELNGAAEMAQRYAAQVHRNGVRSLFASTPDLSLKVSKSSPELATRQRLDVTLENLTELDADQQDVILAKLSDSSTQTSTPPSEASSRDVSTCVSRDCSSSTVCSSQRSSVGIGGVQGFNGKMAPGRLRLDSMEFNQLPDFDDKHKQHSVIPSSSTTVVATTVHNGGLSVERPDLLQSSEATNVSNDERLADMESRLKAGCLSEEFDKIPKKRVSAGVSTSQKAENRLRNRFANILPYEDTRIMLRPHKTNPFGYINASNIQVPLGDSLVKYVATQGPMKEFAADFWQMIWETEAQIIVMLTKCQEESREKSFQYWPKEGDTVTKLKFEDFQVSLQSSTKSQTQITCCLQLKHLPSSQRRTVYHLQYLDWPAGGVPVVVDSFLGYLDEVSSVKRHLENETQRNAENNAIRSRSQSRSSLFDISNHSNTGSLKRNAPGPSAVSLSTNSNRSVSDATSSPLSLIGQPPTNQEAPPVVVHCCSGAGRTGVYILTELMIYCLEHNHSPLPQVRGFDRQFSWWAGGLRSRCRSTSDLRAVRQPTAKLAIKASHLLHRRLKPQE